ncbi:MAG: protein-glutamine glutaminase family protein [Vulcanimicrobiota bacterium]
MIIRGGPRPVTVRAGAASTGASPHVENSTDSVTLDCQAPGPSGVAPWAVAASLVPSSQLFGLAQAQPVLEALAERGCEFRARRGWIPFLKVYRRLTSAQAATNPAAQVRLESQWRPLGNAQDVRRLGALYGLAGSVQPEDYPLVRGLASLHQSGQLQHPVQAFQAVAEGRPVPVASGLIQNAEDACLAAFLAGDVAAGELLTRPEDAEFVRKMAGLELSLTGDHLADYQSLAADQPLFVRYDATPLVAYDRAANRTKLLEKALERKRFCQGLALSDPRPVLEWLLVQKDFDGWQSRLEQANLEPHELQALSRCKPSSSQLAARFIHHEQPPERGHLLTSLGQLDPDTLKGLSYPRQRAMVLDHHRLESAVDRLVADLDPKLRELTGCRPDIEVDEDIHHNGRLATEAELKALAERLRQTEDIPFDYIYDGCYARAHVICRELAKLGINRSKMFVAGDLACSNQYQSVTWGWHVAPLIFVEGPDGPSPRILDPSFSTDPMRPEEWIARFWSSGQLDLEVTHETQYMERPYHALSQNMDVDMPDVDSVLAGYRADLEELKA